jgi:hypothetical protein
VVRDGEQVREEDEKTAKLMSNGRRLVMFPERRPGGSVRWWRVREFDEHGQLMLKWQFKTGRDAFEFWFRRS